MLNIRRTTVVPASVSLLLLGASCATTGVGSNSGDASAPSASPSIGREPRPQFNGQPDLNEVPQAL
jgi:hypothetical protein